MNYDGLGVPVHTWTDLDAFTQAATLDDAVHVIALASGNHLDVLLKGVTGVAQPDQCIPVFFSGALGNRAGTAGPYFSGQRMSRQLGLPLVAFSDSTLNVDETTPLGWYAGTSSDALQPAITAILQWLTTTARRELLLIGGSGGGFAALYYASQVGSAASAFAWNPQTDFLKYSAPAVEQYLRAAGVTDEPYQGTPEQHAEVSARLNAHGIAHRLPAHSEAHRAFVLQNSGDWHVPVHLAPLLQEGEFVHRGRGYYSNASGHGVAIVNFGEGHAAPPQEMLVEVITALSGRTTTPRAAFNRLVDRGFVTASGGQALPRDLREEVDQVRERVSLSAALTPEGLVVSVEGLPDGYGGIKYRLSSYDAAGVRRYHGPSDLPTFVIEDHAGVVDVEVSLHDGFGNYLLTLRERLPSDVGEAPSARADASGAASGAAVPRVFIYGSCVTRDAFALPEAPPFVDYVARSPLGSAFSDPVEVPETVDLQLNSSAFQRRMVGIDLEKQLPSLLASEDFDYLLVDFIDERLPLVRSKGGYLTYSPEASKCGLTPDKDAMVRPGSAEHLRAFRDGWASLLTIVPPSKIVVNRVFWAARTTGGDELPDQAETSRHNGILRQLYALVAESGVRFIDYPDRQFLADAGHKWGLSPFHFAAPLYRTTLESIHRLFTLDTASEGSAVSRPPSDATAAAKGGPSTAAPDAVAAGTASRPASTASAEADPPLSVVMETIFCDYEHDVAVRLKFLESYRLALQSLAAVWIPPGVDAHFVTYLSTDKTVERASIEACIAGFEPDRRGRFTIVDYTHPEEGYGNESATHIDLIKNPNRHVPRRDELFAKALGRVELDRNRPLVRIAFDDDDAWLPWQLREICTAARAALRACPDRASVVGLTNHIVVKAVDRPTADVTAMSRVISGNKFYVSPASMFERMKTASPWAIPESFSEEAASRFKRAGFEMRLVDSNVPGFLYMRRSGSLTQVNKESYYRSKPIALGLESVAAALHLPEFLDFGSGSGEVRFAELERVFEVSAHREDGSLRIESNLSRMAAGGATATYKIMSGDTQVYEVGGVTTDSTVVTATLPPDVYVKAVLYADGRATTSARSRGTV